MKKKITAVLFCGVIAAGMVGCGSGADETGSADVSGAEEEVAIEEETGTEEASGTEAAFTGEPVVYEAPSGIVGGDPIGEYSVLEIPQSEATMEYLTDWLENYVIPSGHLEDIIIYSDRDDGLGVLGRDDSMYVNVYLEQSDTERYKNVGNSDSTVWYEMVDGELVETFSNEDMGAAQGKTAEEALNDYIAEGYEYPARWDFIEQLEYEGYTTEEAESTVGSFDYDWNELAVEDMETWYEIFENIDDAVQQLENDDFTESEIQYALDKLGLK